MNAGRAERIEATADAGAALLLAAAVAYAFWTLTVAPAAVAGAGVAFGLSFVGLRRIQPVGAARLTDRPVATPVNDLLAEADRSLAHAEDELVLDDILAVLSPDSRVVRLFERDHATPRKPADASQALHDALADLRRSLN